MNIKTFIAAAVIALTAACTQAEQAEQTEVVEVPADEAGAAEVELNEDGSVKTEAGDASETVAGASAVAPVGQQHQL